MSLPPPPQNRPVEPPRRKRWLALPLVAVLGAALYFGMWETEITGNARRNIPPACLMMLADMPADEARAEGVPLRDCARRRMVTNRRAQLLGRWVYGPPQAPVDGQVALIRAPVSDRSDMTVDRVMHVSVDGNYLKLNNLTLEGRGCAGGVHDAFVKGDVFGLVINMTPEAIVRFLQSPLVEERHADGDLSTDPMQCSGRLVLQDRRPVMIELNDSAQTPAGAALDKKQRVVAAPPRRQACFDRLVARYVADGRATLTFPDAYATFLADYAGDCLRDVTVPAAPIEKGAPPR